MTWCILMVKERERAAKTPFKTELTFPRIIDNFTSTDPVHTWSIHELDLPRGMNIFMLSPRFHQLQVDCCWCWWWLTCRWLVSVLVETEIFTGTVRMKCVERRLVGYRKREAACGNRKVITSFQYNYFKEVRVKIKRLICNKTTK